MKTSHTVGPWRADAYGVVTGGVNGLTSICETHANKWAMCQASAKSAHNEAPDFCGAMHRESIANAHLIAAAPELLAALQAMLSADEAICENRGTKSDQAMNRIAAIDAARAAIEKAGGSACA